MKLRLWCRVEQFCFYRFRINVFTSRQVSINASFVIIKVSVSILSCPHDRWSSLILVFMDSSFESEIKIKLMMDCSGMSNLHCD